ncbi:MAG TPA: hypothetical protein PL009_09735 [Flavipsychrobacter sp.]|nr:hypothetical protein [Flavipsychrobacter sp.]
MYRLDLVYGSDSYNFIKFVANFFHVFFEEGKNSDQYELAGLIDTLKVQLDLHNGESTVHLQMDLQVLTVFSQLVDWVAKKNLSENETVETIARRTEQICNFQIWHKFLKLSNLFFEQIKQFLQPHEWEEIEAVLNSGGMDSYKQVA